MHMMAQRSVSMTNVCHTIIQWFFWRGLSNCDERHQVQRFEHLYSYSTLLLKQT